MNDGCYEAMVRLREQGKVRFIGISEISTVDGTHEILQRFDFIQPYSVPAAALRFVLAQDVTSCCVGTRSPERVRENLRAVDPPYLEPWRLAKLRELFGCIRNQVR